MGVNYNQIVKLLYKNFSEKKPQRSCINWKNRRLKWRCCVRKSSK
ncbi:hypothetical protein KRR40_34225 [Niabella defluvii]|nr:hypothetical protein KRR40_34225 [Niabella sp. I65]